VNAIFAIVSQPEHFLERNSLIATHHRTGPEVPFGSPSDDRLDRTPIGQPRL
jgi:hypothetical protein